MVEEIARWIEVNNFKYLDIGTIAKKSGFSAWYLQRFFKRRTNIPIGTYTRLRRLSASAVTLKLTSQKISCISNFYGFDSLASFTAAFKRQFGVPPSIFRELENWPFENMIPRYDFLNKIQRVECDIVTMKVGELIIKSQNIDEIALFLNDGVSYYISVGIKKGQKTMLNEFVPGHNFSLCCIEHSNKEQKWLSIKDSIGFNKFSNLQSFVYSGVLPAYGIVRSSGDDIIVVTKEKDNTLSISEYLVPCIEVDLKKYKLYTPKQNH